jgi:hypothetical protein
MKDLNTCLEEAENKFSRHGPNGDLGNIDSLYPILRMIAKQGFIEWLKELRVKMEETEFANQAVKLSRLYQIDEIIAGIEISGDNPVVQFIVKEEKQGGK